MTSSKQEGIFEEAQAQAIKEVVTWQLAEAMKERKISKNKMAKLLKTSVAASWAGPTLNWPFRMVYAGRAENARPRMFSVARASPCQVPHRGPIAIRTWLTLLDRRGVQRPSA